MPRIHYSEAEYRGHLAWFVAHSLIYVVAMALAWSLEWGIAPALSLIWTALMAYHAYWHTPLEDGMQQRTYDRLRNRLGADWDLEASVADFDTERRKALAELRLRHVLPDCALVAMAVMATWVLLLIVRATVVPLDYFLSAAGGYGLTVVLLQMRLRWQIRVARHILSKPRQNKTTIAQRLTNSNSFKLPRSGMTYAVGDDGELVEVQRGQTS